MFSACFSLRNNVFIRLIIAYFMEDLIIHLSDCDVKFVEIDFFIFEDKDKVYENYKKLGENPCLKPHEHGKKRFCTFRIDTQYSCKKGIYCFALDNAIVYVGRCLNNFCKRINMGYGHISPRNCFPGGQSTNCRINAEIYKSYFVDKRAVRLGIFPVLSNNEIVKLERKILHECGSSLVWNIQKR